MPIQSFNFILFCMKRLLIPFLLTLPLFLLSQKMYRSGEWCAESKHLSLRGLAGLGGDGRSDSIDLTHAWITLDMSLAATKTISGNCRWVFTPKVAGVDQLRFDLLGLTVDSVTLNQQMLTFEQIGEQVLIPINPVLQVGSINDVVIYYQGSPQKDASGWGGFYFEGNYAFNLGVGFAADPHVFGRAWFPCFDNFVERSSYTFDIYTTPIQPAYCNGYLLTDEPTADGKRRRLWLLNQPIPSYLASVAIGPYTSFTRNYPGELNTIPVEIAAAAADTVNVRNTFQHLPEAIKAFEYWYGPYKWNKIGFSLVPFNSGAMEHATNVAIGRVYINGTLNYETLWAHELSHHWWGDLATCSTAEDMWLNEGWASYSEHLFTEWVYGKPAYQKAVRDNFLDVLQKAHVEEGGYLATSGVPHNLTYGKHVYNKGAVLAHNLRGYMGDTAFRLGIKSALDNTNFKDWSSADFRDKLENATGQNLDDFFNDWVFTGGYPDYLIDSVLWAQEGLDGKVANIYVKQKLRGAPHFHQNVPLEFTVVHPDGSKDFTTKMVSGENAMVKISFSLLNMPYPQIWVNTNQKILQARSEGEKLFIGTGTTNFGDAKMSVTVNTLGTDSVLFRVEHHFSSPDDAGANPNNYVLTNRFWQVLGSFPTGFDARGIVFYDGRGQLDQLDTELFAATSPSEDSMVLLYRPSAGYPWQEWPTYSKNTLGSASDKFGNLQILHLQAGQYTIGKGVSSTAIKEPSTSLGKIKATPNPTRDLVTIRSENPIEQLQLYSQSGGLLKEIFFEKTRSLDFSLQQFPSGQYWLIASGVDGVSTLSVVKL